MEDPPARPLEERPRKMGNTLPRSGGVFKNAALKVLRTERKLMSTGDVTRTAMSMGLIGQLPGKTPEATMASALYTDIKKWKDGKPGSLFCRPREGLFGLREWTKDEELSHLVEGADEFFGVGLVARPRSPHGSHSSGGTSFDHGSADPGAKRRRKSPPAAPADGDADEVEDAGLLLLLGAAGDDSIDDDEDADDAEKRERGAKKAKREDSEADGRGTSAAAAASGRDTSEERALAPVPALAPAPSQTMLTLTVAIADARARGDARTAETLEATRRAEIISADAELRDVMRRAGRIISRNGASAEETREAWKQAFTMAASRGIDRCEAAMMVLDEEQKAKLERGDKPKPQRRATAPEGTTEGTGTGTGTRTGTGTCQELRGVSDTIIRALSSSQAQTATASPGVVADPPPVAPGSGLRFDLGLGVGLGPSTAAASGDAASISISDAALAERRQLDALIPSFVNRTLELYAALGPHPTTIQSLLALLALFTRAARPLEAEEAAARLWDMLRAAAFPGGLGENPQTISALRLRYASMVHSATANTFPTT